MSKISIQSLSKSLGGRDLLRDFSLEITPGTRLAVVGPNGCGKSTFLRLLAGEAEPDAGRIVLSPGAMLGYVSQELEAGDLSEPLLSWVMSALPSWAEFWREWERACLAGDDKALAALAGRQAELEFALGYNPEARAKAIVTGLGFAPKKFGRTLAEFSGGWRERAKLARVLVTGADVLLLDEPTNHLDLEAVEWLEEHLINFSGALVFVAHDRMFLDRVGNQALFLGGDKPLVRPGTFSELMAWRAQTEAQREQRAARLSLDIERQMAFVERFRAKATKATQAQSRLKAAGKLRAEMEELQAGVSRPTRSLSFSLPEPARSEKTVLSAVDISVTFPDGFTPWKPLSFSLFRGQKVALVGANGAGKTTLLKLIAGASAPTTGSLKLGSGVRLGYFSQHQTEILNPSATVMTEMRRLADPKTAHEQLCSVLGLFLLGEEYFERSVGDLSGGEKSRLVLASLFLARANFLVLDEPTNHLDLESREALVRALADYSGTLLFVAHDRHLLAEAAQTVWAVDGEGVREFPGGFAAYEHVLKEQAACAAQGQAGAQNRSDQGSRLAKQEAKRLEAERRNALYRELRPRQERFAALEAQLERTLAEQAEVEAHMADPAVYAKADLFTELSKRYHELGRQAESLLAELSVLEGEIGELEGRRETR